MKTQRCEACHVGMKTLNEQEVKEALKNLHGWVYKPEHTAIQKTFSFKGYYATIAFLNAIAWIAHQNKHHPDMQVSYNTLTVSYHTHETGGITRNDLICAAQVDALMSEE